MRDDGKVLHFTDREKMWNYILDLGRKLNSTGRRLYVYGANHNYDWHVYADRKNQNLKELVNAKFLIHMMEDNEMFEERKKNYTKWKRAEPKAPRAYITFLDLFSIFTSAINTEDSRGLARVGELIGYGKIEAPDKFYEKTRDEITDDDMVKIKYYCERDTKIVMEALKFVKERLKEDGIVVRVLYSINQIAMNYCLNMLKKTELGRELFKVNKYGGRTEFWEAQYPDLYQKGDRFHSKWCRGGFVRAFKKGKYDNCIKIDNNGCWQNCLRNMKFPNLKTEMRIRRPLKGLGEEIYDYIGVCFAIVRTPNTRLPFLQIRMNDVNQYIGDGNLIVGHWTLKELKYARSIGYEVLDMEYATVWQEMDNPLKEVVETIYSRRKESKTAFDNWFYKQMGNSFLGKFAMAFPEYDIINVEVDEREKYEAEGYEVCYGYDRFYKMQKAIGLRKRSYYAPIIYALATAESRIFMHQAYRKIPFDKLLYSDTDSIVMENIGFDVVREKFVIGDKLGEWKFENKEVNRGMKAQIWKNKFYSFGEDVKSSGVSVSEENKEMFKEGKMIRKRMITDRMNCDGVESGEFKLEEIDLRESNPQIDTQKVYIDEYITSVGAFNKVIRREISGTPYEI